MILITLSLFAAACCSASPSRNATRQDLDCSIQSFKDLVTGLPGVTVTILKADVVTNGSYSDPANKGFPLPADLLPEVCAVTVKVTNTTEQPQSDYGFGMFLPAQGNWNKRMLTVGSGSFAGGINWVEMGQGPHFGFATLSTDNGHNSAPSDLTWATPATLLDWGYRAMHGSVQVGKLLIAHYYGNNTTRSYYSGCSTGGRQGLREIQYDATSFDGALIGAAAWDTKHLMPWISRIAHDQLVGNDADILGLVQLNIIATEVLSQCDNQGGTQDNISDGIVSDPQHCNFNISKIVCADPQTCITAGQAATAQRIYSDYVVNGTLVSHGFLPGSEAQWSVYFSDQIVQRGFDFDYERYFLYNNTNYTYSNFDDKVVTDSERINPGQATADHFDISPFRDRSGKILMYHGLADGLISPKTSEQYYNATADALGGTAGLRSWFRYFEIPGMDHCSFSSRYNAPWDVGGAGQAAALRSYYKLGDGWSVPGHLGDPLYDALAALMGWVENGTAVDKIVATAFNTDLSVVRTRPICPWPQRARFSGTGNINDASNWSCS